MATPSAVIAACIARLTPGSGAAATLVAQRDFSRVYRVACDGRVIAVKECLDGAGNRDVAGAQREYDALRAIAQAGQRAGVAPLTPVPLVAWQDLGAYAMTWADGRSLTRALLDSRTDASEAHRLGRAAGEWLRQFHALAAAAPRTHDFAGRLAYIESVAARRPRDGLIARAAALLTASAARAVAVETPQSWIHGDMKTDNLMVEDGAMIGLDVQLADRNTVVYDIAPFLNHLARLGLSARGYLRRHALKALREGFLGAYAPPGWSLPVTWLRAYLLMQAAVPSGTGSPLRRAVSVWNARTALAAVLDELETMVVAA